MKIEYKIVQSLSIEELLPLYEDAGWKAYTSKPETLKKAIVNSTLVYTAYHEDILVGLIRVVSDQHTILYIQDILVKKAYKRNGIGTHFMRFILEKYVEIRQIVLLTDDSPETRLFYESLGFSSCDKGAVVAFIYDKPNN